MRRHKTLLLLASLGFATAAAPAAAESNPYTPKEVCGSGYEIIDRERHRDNGIHLGTTFLMWNGATGDNCVVTLKYHEVGELGGVMDRMGAEIRKRGGPWRSDDGEYRYYAGPRHVHAPSTCVQWGGWLFRVSVSEPYHASFRSGWGHCG